MTLHESITACNSFDELYKVIDAMPEDSFIIGSHRSYTKEMLLQKIVGVENGWLPFICITRSCGLRERVMTFKKYPQEQIEYYCQHD